MMELFNDPELWSNTSFLLWLNLIIIWDTVWKSIALWKSARNGHKIWFVFLIIVNSIGILPIVYLLFFAEKGKQKSK